MALIALDTMILIWGIRRGGKASQKGREHRAGILLRTLEEQKAQVVVPTISIAELLVPVPREDHGKFINELQKRFICPPFDVQAASIAADLWRQNSTLTEIDQLSRKTLKADVQIIATAKAAGATKFFSHDRKCRKLTAI